LLLLTNRFVIYLYQNFKTISISIFFFSFNHDFGARKVRSDLKKHVVGCFCQYGGSKAEKGVEIF